MGQRKKCCDGSGINISSYLHILCHDPQLHFLTEPVKHAHITLYIHAQERLDHYVDIAINSLEHKGSFKIPENILLTRSNCPLDGNFLDPFYFTQHDIKSYCVGKF